MRLPQTSLGVRRPAPEPAQVWTGAVRETNGEVCISNAQRRIHVATEAVAVFAVAPFLIYLAATKENLKDWERGILYAVAGGTLLVDGGLLLSFSRKKR